MAKKEHRTAVIRSIKHRPQDLKYEVVFAIDGARLPFVMRKRPGSAFQKANEEGDSGIVVYAGKRFVDWRSTGLRVLSPGRRSTPKHPKAPRTVFVSYPHQHQVDAKWVRDVLAGTGHEVWLDTELQPGDRLGTAIVDRIVGCDVFVPVLSNEYARSDWCLRELEVAAEHKIRVAPVSFDERTIDFPPATRRIYEESLGEPLMVRLRDADADVALQRLAVNLGRGGL